MGAEVCEYGSNDEWEGAYIREPMNGALWRAGYSACQATPGIESVKATRGDGEWGRSPKGPVRCETYRPTLRTSATSGTASFTAHCPPASDVGRGDSAGVRVAARRKSTPARRPSPASSRLSARRPTASTTTPPPISTSCFARTTVRSPYISTSRSVDPHRARSPPPLPSEDAPGAPVEAPRAAPAEAPANPRGAVLPPTTRWPRPRPAPAAQVAALANAAPRPPSHKPPSSTALDLRTPPSAAAFHALHPPLRAPDSPAPPDSAPDSHGSAAASAFSPATPSRRRSTQLRLGVRERAPPASLTFLLVSRPPPRNTPSPPRVARRARIFHRARLSPSPPSPPLTSAQLGTRALPSSPRHRPCADTSDRAPTDSSKRAHVRPCANPRDTPPNVIRASHIQWRESEPTARAGSSDKASPAGARRLLAVGRVNRPGAAAGRVGSGGIGRERASSVRARRKSRGGARTARACPAVVLRAAAAGTRESHRDDKGQKSMVGLQPGIGNPAPSRCPGSQRRQHLIPPLWVQFHVHLCSLISRDYVRKQLNNHQMVTTPSNSTRTAHGSEAETKNIETYGTLAFATPSHPSGLNAV
ncbi:hypothetical protein B0H15DRAFT_1022702 [Mycena belliarum]|uniref:Uncharacterized protein n=1 Tax=Mycena belliarum TaxID=1033014 RepID=A0AAD6U3Y6_9AGAR|nr:hypothetical protein B0H15DRAFT_1022702 [Mycena belliae]